MEPRWACMPVVADSHNFDEVQDPESDPHQSEKTDLYLQYCY